MKVEKKMQIELEHGKVHIAWDSAVPEAFNISIGDEDYLGDLKRQMLLDIIEACQRVLVESDTALKSLVTSTSKTAKKK